MTQTTEKRAGRICSKRLILVRHAQVAAGRLGQLIGSTDVPLDSVGQSQAQSLAARVRHWAPEVCYCSPMLRCRQMVEAAAGHLAPQFDPDLREIDFGRWETRTFAELMADDPSLAARWNEFRPDFAFPGGESVGDFLDRVYAATDRLVRAEAETVLAVTHGGVIRMMICRLLGLDPRHYLAFNVSYAAIVVLDVFDGKGVLAALEQPAECHPESSEGSGMPRGKAGHADEILRCAQDDGCWAQDDGCCAQDDGSVLEQQDMDDGLPPNATEVAHG